MANSRANPTGWLFGEFFTEDQANTIDINQARSVDGRAGQLQIESHSVTRLAEAQPVIRPSLSADLNLFAPWQVSTLSTNAVEFWWPIKVPSGATITGWSLTVQGDGGHSGLPGTKPIVRLVGPGGSIGGFIADPSANAAAYDAAHTISLSGLSAVIDNAAANVLYLEISTETGANSRAGTRYTKASVTFTVGKLDEG